MKLEFFYDTMYGSEEKSTEMGGRSAEEVDTINKQPSEVEEVAVEEVVKASFSSLGRSPPTRLPRCWPRLASQQIRKDHLQNKSRVRHTMSLHSNGDLFPG